jgi:hypothetical protein
LLFFPLLSPVRENQNARAGEALAFFSPHASELERKRLLCGGESGDDDFFDWAIVDLSLDLLGSRPKQPPPPRCRRRGSCRSLPLLLGVVIVVQDLLFVKRRERELLRWGRGKGDGALLRRGLRGRYRRN